ncbi:hypothetical protein HK103_001488 [Boothiomyces macroporosus]|uniref:Transmembrane protein 135 N-terminal domain-containing protein n=1 Tax=Boothiomyces macroporosus TaxID=261099 RepID=A0AAD5UKG0_9FUNG|nr:hypothetical protein HK103_001488 [Boothiomyces macroporosus]
MDKGKLNRNQLESKDKNPVTIPKWNSFSQILMHALKGSSRAFAISFLIRGGITFLLSLNKLVRKKIGAFSLIWKLVSNTLVYVEGHHSKRQGAVAGFLSGFAILLETRQNRIGFTQQFFMRSMQAGKNALKQRKIPTVPHGDTLLFCLACAQLLYASAFRPSTLPREYYGFIIRTAKVPKQFLVGQALHLQNMRDIEYKADDTMVKVMESLGGTPTNIQKLKERIAKHSGRMIGLPCGIYHPKDDSCLKCAALKWTAVYRQMSPVYLTLNFVPLLVLKTKQFISSILNKSFDQSSIQGYSFPPTLQYFNIAYACSVMRYQTPVQSAFSGLSILFEQKQKRAELAMYCLPKAAQSLYRMLVAKGKIVYVPHLEILASCVSWSLIMSLYQKEPEHISTMLYKMMKAVLGTY